MANYFGIICSDLLLRYFLYQRQAGEKEIAHHAHQNDGSTGSTIQILMKEKQCLEKPFGTMA